MKKKLPKWYQLASITIIEESLLDKKVEIVNKLAKSAEMSWCLECIKFFCGKKVEDTFKENFISSLVELDPLFPQANNDLELRILAGAIIYNRIIKIDDYNSIKLALALSSCSFGLDKDKIINSDIFEEVHNYLLGESIRERELNNPEFDKIDRIIIKADKETNEINVDKAFIEVKARFSEMKTIFDELLSNQFILAEESNIHWWLFNGFSRLINMPMKDLNIKEASFIYALELNNLTQYVTPPRSAKMFLHKLFEEYQKTQFKNEEEQCIKDIVNQFIEKYSKFEKKEGLGTICPLTMACNYRMEAEDNELWVKKYQNGNSINLEDKVSCLDLSYQFYIENLLFDNLDIK